MPTTSTNAPKTPFTPRKYTRLDPLYKSFAPYLKRILANNYMDTSPPATHHGLLVYVSTSPTFGLLSRSIFDVFHCTFAGYYIHTRSDVRLDFDFLLACSHLNNDAQRALQLQPHVIFFPFYWRFDWLDQGVQLGLREAFILVHLHVRRLCINCMVSVGL
jgi:hypothetical protein